MEFTVVVLVICSIILFLLSYNFLVVKYQKGGRLPPGPTPLPVIGNLLQFCKHPTQVHRVMADLAKIYGPLMSLKLGMINLVIVSSSDMAREVLQKNDQALSSRWLPDNPRALNHYELSIPWLSSSSPLWKHLRTIMATHLMSNRCLDITSTMRQEKTQQLMTYFRNNAGRPVKICLPLFTAMLNVVSNLLFSEDVAHLGSSSSQKFRDLIFSALAELPKPNISDFYPFLRPLDLQGRRRTSGGYLLQFYEIFDEIINRRLSRLDQQERKNGDFLDSLLELESDSKLDRRTIKILLTDLFIAGAESGSITVEWAMAELLRNPSAMSKAQAELKEKIGYSKAVEETDIYKLPYLQAIIKEVMRLHPAGPLMLPRQVPEDGIKMGEFTLPKDSRVMINLWAIGRDATAWPEPDVFMPERFLDSKYDFHGQDFEFIPFSSGRRSCPGLPFGVKIISLTLASMLHEFEWRLPEGMTHNDVNLQDKFALTLEPAVSLLAVPVPLSQSQSQSQSQ